MTELQFLVRHIMEYPPHPAVFEASEPQIVQKKEHVKPRASFRGEELLRIRKLQRLSQSEAAAIVGVITKTYSLYEANVLPIPKFRFDRIAARFSEGGKK